LVATVLDSAPGEAIATALLDDLYRSSESESEADRILAAWRAQPLTARQEKIVRVISSRYYQRGYCFAKQATLARAVGCAKSTLQDELEVLADRGFLILERRQGTSNITLLAPGLQEALRIIKAQRRPKPSRAAIIVNSIEKVGQQLAVARAELVESVTQTVASFSQQIAHVCDQNRPKTVSQSRDITHVSLSSRALHSKKDEMQNAVKKTIDELTMAGVTPWRARQLIELSGLERVKRNLALGQHKHATNPGGYRAEAIRRDYAATRPIPGSEAYHVHEKERAAANTICAVPVDKIKSKPALIPEHHLDIAAAKFAQVPDQQRFIFEQQAQHEIEKAPPFWAVGLLTREGLKHQAIQGLIRAKAIELWQSCVASFPARVVG